MTPKQERFSQNVINGMNYSDAYRDAYDAEGSSPETIWQNASTLAENTEVSLRIQEGNKAIQDAGLLSRAEGLKEVKENLDGARLAGQWGPANQATKQRLELSGLTQAQAPSHVAINQITINKTYKVKDLDVVEAEEWTIDE